MTSYQAPGVYLRPKRSDTGDLRLIRTDVVGFAGFAERGPLPFPDRVTAGGAPVRAEDFAVRLTSWDEYGAVFGGFIDYGYLPYAVRGFFENGGTTCHVVRVAVIDPERAGRASPARVAFPAALAGTAAVVQEAAPGDSVLHVDDGTALAGCDLLEIVQPDGAYSERHVPVSMSGSGVTLGGSLRAGFAAHSVVRGYRAALAVEATSAGSWGNRIRLTLQPLRGSATDFALTVELRPGREGGSREIEPYRRLSLDPNDPAYAPNLVNGRSKLIQLRQPAERRASPTPAAAGIVVPLAIDLLGDTQVQLEGGSDGLAGIALADFTGGPDDFRGLRLLEDVDEVSILCVPDAMLRAEPRQTPPKVPVPPCAPPVEDGTVADDEPAAAPSPAVFAADLQGAMIAQCERLRDRVTILDPPADLHSVAALRAWRDTVSTRFGATYYPWLKVPDPLAPPDGFRLIPPSGHVAGVYAATDNAYGVHRPPANAALEGVVDLADSVSAAQQEELNPYGINALRAFPGRGMRVWGARALADPLDADWRYIHTRRLMSMLEESVEDSMQWTVFEPNDQSLRRTLVHAITVFLTQIWQKGGLKGAVPAEAFFVKCDETNNPPPVVDAGEIVCEVGVAVAAPMEFLVFEIRQKPETADVTEA